jgi:hypothetical protein
MRNPLGEAAIAYRDLATCYRIGKRPPEALFKMLDEATRPLAEYLAQRDAPQQGEDESVDGPNAVEVDGILGKPHYSVGKTNTKPQQGETPKEGQG